MPATQGFQVMETVNQSSFGWALAALVVLGFFLIWLVGPSLLLRLLKPFDARLLADLPKDVRRQLEQVAGPSLLESVARDAGRPAVK